MRRRCNNDGGLALVFLGLLFLPIIGLAFAFDDDPTTRGLGAFLVVVGLVVWFVAFNS